MEEQIDRDNPGALRRRARALRADGKTAEAAAIERRALEASTRLPVYAAAAQALQSGNANGARNMLERLIGADPEDVLALSMLGLQWVGQREYERAEPLLRRAVELAPDEPSTRMALAELLVRSNRPLLALSELDAIAGDASSNVAVQSLRAEAYSALGRLEEELAIVQPLAKLSGGRDVGFGLRTGHALRSLGREAEAAAAYRGIIVHYPGEGAAWWSLANLKTISLGDDDIAAVEAVLERPDMPVQNRIRLNFALGKAQEDRGNAAAAFAHYDAGNRLRASTASINPNAIGEWVDKCIATFTPDLFATRAGQGAAPRDPIFIVGMQRSGSTLVEQILASHPAIEGTAELTDIPNLVRLLGEEAAEAGVPFERHIASLPADRLRALGESYLATASDHRRTDRPNFTDKMPNNWMYLGLIRLILPHARIVDVRRDPMACCFSNWKQLYAQGFDHSNALDTMGRHYADYVRLMRHFDAVQPGMVHRVIYDDLVEDLESGVRGLLDYLGLPFDPACMEFHANDRAVRTISAGQVRRPINRDGMGQWKPYDQWLGPLREGLGETLEHWRD